MLSDTDGFLRLLVQRQESSLGPDVEESPEEEIQAAPVYVIGVNPNGKFGKEEIARAALHAA